MANEAYQAVYYTIHGQPLYIGDVLRSLSEMVISWEQSDSHIPSANYNTDYYYGFESGMAKAAEQLLEEIDKLKAIIEDQLPGPLQRQSKPFRKKNS